MEANIQRNDEFLAVQIPNMDPGEEGKELIAAFVKLIHKRLEDSMHLGTTIAGEEDEQRHKHSTA